MGGLHISLSHTIEDISLHFKFIFTDGSWMSDTWPSGGNRNDGPDMGWNMQPQGNNKGSAYPDDDQEGDLETILRGVPGMDFPNFVTVPDTDFDCSTMPSQGYYGDVEAGCQVDFA